MKTNTQKFKKTATKSQQLAALNEQKQVAWEAYRASGEGLVSYGPHGKAWGKINRKVEQLERSFLVYRGREIDAVTVAIQSGDLTISSASYITAEERLHRAADGTYYLWQELWQDKATVRKLTLEGALLWACARVNIYDPGLRDDVVALFEKGGAR